MREAQGWRVLVVEDEARLRELMVRAIPQMGFAVEAVGTAEAALQALERDARAIVVADLNLPGMSGLEMLQTIKQRWPQTPAVILTAFGDLEAARHAIRLEVADFLTKPCPLGELEQALERARRRLAGRSDPPFPSEPAARMIPEASLGQTPADGSAPTLEEVERQQILTALSRHQGNRAAAAAELGISLRTLYYRLKQYQRE